MKLSCIIVDDEPGAVSILEEYVYKLNTVHLAGKFFNSVDAFHFMKLHKVDIVLLDINMPEVDGFALLEMLDHKPVVIFTTAYSNYALKAYESGAIDYLHKPIRFERFVRAMEKAEKWRLVHEKTKKVDVIELKVEKRILAIKTADILYIECSGNYLKFHTQKDQAVVLMTMREIEAKLPDSEFIRIHKSYIVNVSKITAVKGARVFLGGAYLPLGKTYIKYFMKFTGKAGA
jgi:DNA-binding LytR/AlgR family response regulator